jgi:hypothetical protein
VTLHIKFRKIIIPAEYSPGFFLVKISLNTAGNSKTPEHFFSELFRLSNVRRIKESSLKTINFGLPEGMPVAKAR